LSPLFAENTTVFFSQEQVEHTKRRRKGGEDVAVFLEALASGGVAVLMEDFTFLAGEEGGQKGPREGLGGPQGGLDDSLHRGGGGEVVRQA